ncbi:SET domain-containing protein-lysine N-methyltransferase [Candidatus Roizmanbacteria bacterium]|nr:SET domain-containing protein-lysine N-methyltransferase [Candidatus Roizmanbacteria bacterium]
MNKKNHYASYEVREIDRKGKGVFAVKKFSREDVVVIGRIAQIVPKRTSHSFQIAYNQHVDLDEPARLINHSCDPNCGIQQNVFGGYSFIAMRKIKPGEEITWDYCMSEYISIAVSTCLCRTAACRGTIRGWKYLPLQLKKKYKDYMAPYLLPALKLIEF